MITVLQNFAVNGPYYVNVGLELLLPFAFIISFAVGFLANKFMEGGLKYAVLVLFALSFSAWWFMMFLDDVIFKWVMPLVVVIGLAISASGIVNKLFVKRG